MKRRYLKNLTSSLLVAIMSVSLIACGSQNEPASNNSETVTSTENTTVENTPTDTSTVAEEVSTGATMDDVNEQGQMRSFLTGQFEDVAIRNRRPVAIMTENTKECQPLYGPSRASVVYECPVEGQITRLMCIYEDYSGLDRIGNVRSCRPYYLMFMVEFDSIYCHAGQSAQGKIFLDTGLFDNLNALLGNVGNAMYYRSNEAQAPHNLYTSADGIDKGIELMGYRRDHNDTFPGHYYFSLDETNTLPDGEDCQVVKFYYQYNHPWFEYNPADGLYYRYQFGDKMIDNNTGEQLTCTNIIFQEHEWELFEGTQYLNITTNGGGKGKFFTQGKMIDITWARENDADITHYYDMSGNEIRLNPGVTWVQVGQNTYADDNQYYATIDEFKAAN